MVRPVMFSLLVVVSATSVAASGPGLELKRTVPLTRPSAVRIDARRVEERTREYERLQAQQHAPREAADQTRLLLEQVSAARQAHRASPTGWDRWQPGLWRSDAELARTRAALGHLRSAATAAKTVEAATSHLVTSLPEASRGTRGSKLVEERHRWVLERLSAIEAELVAEAGSMGQRSGAMWRRWRGQGAAAGLQALEEQLHRWRVAAAPPVLSAELTYVHAEPSPAALTAGATTPRYARADLQPPELEDTSLDREVALTPEIQAKAAELQTPVGAANFVRNELRLVWYRGSMKGAVQTLRERSGNDADLAALLISLLRAQGTPARYVVGTIELPTRKLADLMGLLTAEDHAAAKLAPEMRDLALAGLKAAAIPFEPVISGGEIASVRVEHVWVEAFVAMSDYRGAGRLEGGRQWIPIDPAIPGGTKYLRAPAKVGAFAGVSPDPETWTEAFLRDPLASSPLEAWRERVIDWLTANAPGQTYADALRHVEQVKEELPLLAAALPYKVVGVSGEHAFLPDAWLHRIHLEGADAGGALFELELPAYRLVGRRTVLAYVPATELDQSVISAAGGLYAAPAAAVDVKAQLRVDGVALTTSERSVGLGMRHRWRITLVGPSGDSRTVENEIIAGNAVAIGLGAPRNEYLAPAPGAIAGDADGPAPRILYDLAARYANAWTAGEEELAALVDVVPVRPTPNLVLVENQLTVDEVYGIPQRLHWDGLQVDADFRSIRPLELTPGRAEAMLRLAGFEGSFQEDGVLEARTGAAAVSAVTLLQEAHRRNLSIVDLDPSNLEARIGEVTAPSEVLADVRDLVTRGRHVRIPAAPIAINQWVGTGFVAHDPRTQEGGYFLAGRLSGGQTTISPEFWTDQELVDQLGHPDRPNATEDRTLIARIVKVEATNNQRGVVDEILPTPLAVYVTTAEGVPVKRASVSFLRYRDSEAGIARAGATDGFTDKLMVETDEYGRAEVSVRLDKTIWHSVIFEKREGKEHRQMIGLNEITAQTWNGVSTITLAYQFQALADPGPRHKVQTVFPDRATNYVEVDMGIEFTAVVLDEFDNPLANETVTWKQDPVDAGRFLKEYQPKVAIYDPADPNQLPTLSQVTPTSGEVNTAFVMGPGTGALSQVVKLKATVPPVDPEIPIEGVYRLRINDVPDGKILLVMPTWRQETINGLYEDPPLHAPKPALIEILQWTDLGGDDEGWVGINGTEGKYSEVSVSMDVRDEGTLLIGDNHVKKTPNTVEPIPGDTEMNTAFWIPFVHKEGRQLAEFTARVIDAGGANRASTQMVITSSRVGPLVIDVERKQVDGTWLSTGKCALVTPQDLGDALVVANPGGEPIHLEVEEKPDVVGSPLATFIWGVDFDLDDRGRIVVPGNTTRRFAFVPDPRTSGGSLKIKVHAPDPIAGEDAERMIEEKEIRVSVGEEQFWRAPGSNLLAKVILPVRNFESAAGGDTPPTEPPILVPGRLDFCVAGSGRVTVTSGKDIVADATVWTDAKGAVHINHLGGYGQPVLTSAGTLATYLAPGDPAGQDVKLEFVPSRLGIPPRSETYRLETRIQDAGVLPVGHTFVKDVSIVDGHLVKQSEDLRLPGRGSGLSFSRTYTNQGWDVGALGPGWHHNLRSFVLATMQAGLPRYMVVGADGGGQVFDCDANSADCKPQRGHHGTLTVATTLKGLAITFRSKAGVNYQFDQSDPRYDTTDPNSLQARRYRLGKITDPTGNVTTYEYGKAAAFHELVRVYEPGFGRYLQLKYKWHEKLGYPQLQTVEVMSNASAVLLPADEDGSSAKICLLYGYDEKGRLTSATRANAACEKGGGGGRSESYTYVVRPFEWMSNNLETAVDPNGVVTKYEWYDEKATFEGESSFTRFGDKQERIRFVTEANGAKSEFKYSLKRGTRAIAGTTVATYETTVTDPLGRDTVYAMDPYGSASEIRRPLPERKFAIDQTLWDATHQRPKVTIDARGRRTTFDYDALGNLIRRTMSTSALSMGGPATVAVKDEKGGTVSTMVDQWSYDPEFAALTCHVDPSGRARVQKVDGETGLVLQQSVLGRFVGSSSCDSLSGSGGGASDIVTEYEYCGVNGSCPAGAKKGDLVAELRPNEHLRRITAFDGLGFPRTETVSSPSLRTSVTTTLMHDDRGQLLWTKDSLGRVVNYGYDDLGRRTSAARQNRFGSAFSEGWSYAPNGALTSESRGSWSRSIQLNNVNLPESIDESGRVTTYQYDLAGNNTVRTDARGVRTVTHFDEANRPYEVRVSVDQNGAAAFKNANGFGDNAGTGGLIATYEHDAVGNKVAETDRHGNRTEYTLDSAYRVVETRLPSVPAAEFGGSVRYVLKRGYDLAGNVVLDVDGNGSPTQSVFDFAGRLKSRTDAEGRVEEFAYDDAGNELARTSRAGATVLMKRTVSDYDALDRPQEVTEVVARGGGAATSATYVTRYRYDDAGRKLYVQDARGMITSRVLDDLGRVISETRDIASTEGLTRDLPAEAGLPVNATTTTSYDASGNPAVVTDALGRTTTTIYDSFGAVLSRDYPMGVRETFAYDSNGAKIRHDDVRNIIRKYYYDVIGRPTKEVLVESLSNGGKELTVSAVEYTDGQGGDRALETNARGFKTLHVKDALGREFETVDPKQQKVLTRFDAVNVRAVQDRKGFIVRHQYDRVGRKRFQREYTTTGALAYVQEWLYDDAARLVTYKDRRKMANAAVGATLVEERDGRGRLIASRRSAGTTVQVQLTEYDLGGNVVRSVDANGNAVTRVYDGLGRAISETVGAGSVVAGTTIHSYDLAGNLLTSKGPRVTGSTFDVRMTYDDLNRVVLTEDGSGNTTSAAYDEAGHKVCERRPLGGPAFARTDTPKTVHGLQTAVCAGTHLTRWSYDEAGALVSVTDAVGGIYTFVYDARRNLLAKQDPNLNLVTYTYDELDRRTHESEHLDAHARILDRGSVPVGEASGGENPRVLTRITHYDANGNPDTFSDPKGQLTIRTFGVLNRLDSERYLLHAVPRALPSTDSIGYLYDPNGNLTTVTEAKATVAGFADEVTDRTFDGLDRLRFQKRYDGKLTEFRYDTKGNRTHVIDSAGVATVYAYDERDRLEEVTTPAGITTYGYWPDSLKKSTRFVLDKEVNEVRCYDDSGRLTLQVSARGTISDECKTSGVPLSKLAYAYDRNGNRLTLLEDRTDPGTQGAEATDRTEYGYDEADRLIGVRYPDDTTTLYRLDGKGNRTGEKRARSSMVAALTVAAFAALSPDVALANVEAQFNRVDWLLSTTDSKDASKNVAFDYDLNGNQILRVGPLKTREFQWDARDTLTAVIDGSEVVGRYDYDWNRQRIRRQTADENVEYVIDDGFVLEELDAATDRRSQSRRYHYGAGPLAVTSGGVTRFITSDALGSPIDAVATDGTLAEARKYDAWGNHREGTEPAPNAFKLGFTGHQYDPESGLVYARARYYDSKVGRFLSRDAYEGDAGSTPSLHRFAYAHVNPVAFVDPTGRSCTNVHAAPGCQSVLHGGEFVEVTTTVTRTAASEVGATSSTAVPAAGATSSTATVSTTTLPWWKVAAGSIWAAITGTDLVREEAEAARRKAEFESALRAAEEANANEEYRKKWLGSVSVEQELGQPTRRVPLEAPGNQGGARVDPRPVETPRLESDDEKLPVVNPESNPVVPRVDPATDGRTLEAAKGPTDSRVKLRKQTMKDIQGAQPRNDQGQMIDPNTKKPLVDGEIDVGHKPGNEWRVRKEMHKQKGSTRAEVIEAENDPNLYQLEDQSQNRSHRYEKKP